MNILQCPNYVIIGKNVDKTKTNTYAKSFNMTLYFTFDIALCKKM